MAKNLKQTAPALKAVVAAFDSENWNKLANALYSLQNGLERDLRAALPGIDVDTWTKGENSATRKTDYVGTVQCLVYRKDDEYGVSFYFKHGKFAIAVYKGNRTRWVSKAANDAAGMKAAVDEFVNLFDANGFRMDK